MVYAVDVNASVEDVFAAVVDWPSQGDWIPLTKVQAEYRDGVGVGGEISAFTGIGQVGFLDTMTITNWDPPHRVDVVHTGEVVRGTATMAVKPLSDGRSRFYWMEDLELPMGALGRLGWIVLKPGVDVGMRRALGKFAALIERSRGNDSFKDGHTE